MTGSMSVLLHAAASIAALQFALSAGAAEVTVRVAGPLPANGSIGCALYSTAAGFPMDSSGARMQWLPARADGVTCSFDDVPHGVYAVSVVHDLNGNRRVDTNVFGLPKEAWGVSNNARPALRAPRFDEAAFEVVAGRPVALDLRIGK